MSAWRHKVGDKVKVREDLDNKCTYGGIGVSPTMVGMCGEILTIESIEKERNHIDHYHVEENSWNWTDQMLEDVILLKPAEISNDRQDECSFEEIKTDISDLINFYKK